MTTHIAASAAASTRKRANRPLPVRRPLQLDDLLHPFASSRRRPRRAGRRGGEEGLSDAAQFVRGVAGETDAGGEPGGESRVGGEEAVHLRLVAGEDDDEAVAVVLGPLQQGLHCFVAEPVGLAVPLVDERVRLVDEQHPAQGPVHEFVGFDRGRAEVLPNQVGAARFNHACRGEQPEGVEDRGEGARNTVLPVPGGLEQSGAAAGRRCIPRRPAAGPLRSRQRSRGPAV